MPSAANDVFFDGNGQALVVANTSFICDNFTMEATCSHILLMIYQGGIIQGDFEQHEGYFGPTGGGGYTIEFQGNWLFDGGSFSVGTGTGVDPTCEFSGTDKTYVNNNLSAASFQNFLVSGSYEFSGTRLSVANIQQQLSITGTMEIYGVGATRNQVYLNGVNAAFGTFTGTITGGGRFVFVYRDGDTVPATGTIECAYFKFLALSGLAGDSISQDLAVEGWTNVNQDWTHTGVEPWIDVDDGDSNYISIAADAPLNDYDEYYTFEDMDPIYVSFTPTNVRVHVKARLYDGSSGHATIFGLTAWIWDGSVWQNAGGALFNSTSYVEYTCTNISGVIDTLAKVNGMRLKLELTLIVGGGADFGGLNVTEAFVEIDGTAYRNPVFEIAPRTWDGQVEFEYTDDAQTFRFLGTDRHYFMNYFEILGNYGAINTALLDFATYTAQIYVYGIFDVDNNAFPSAVFTIRFGDGTHVFRGTIDLYFAYSAGASTQLVVDPGEGTLILWPRGLRKLVLP
ncbi:MAG: hypothetical protein DRJ03_01255 [Chloroflexi bacterium]|nr:MAG: hypothetical protein DRJ03_01255 [Chloroflexota bacterium]